ncbi:MAG: NUDIX hydrolase [Chloroflexi bacterium]|nr:NUDIX hydrolase [Chloroflexota bacterium]MBI3732395.1 NUDIX hydrolase [Chloroflexota bacterium]
MSRLLPVEPDEVRRLSRQFGAPRRALLTLARPPLSASEHADRRAEVVLAIRRSNGRVLLHTKSFYPPGVFRLLSGGIHWDEGVEDALRREATEETGLAVEVERFVALVRYRANGRPLAFASYIFLLNADGPKPSVQDIKERIAAFREVKPERLRAVAQQLRSLPENWRDWGEFRALSHELVADALRPPAATRPR